MFGALNMRASRIYWKQEDKANSQQFIMILHQLHKANRDKKMMIILDNGPIHKSKKVQRFLQKHPWVELFFLPAYAPEYNPIERFWHWLKQKVYGCKPFLKMENLIQQIRKLIWHYHENKTVSKINFNFQAYNDLL